MQRRDFLQTSGLLALGAVAPLTLASGCNEQRRLDDIGIQLYTLRNELAEDLAGTLRRVADIGYTYVEGFGYNEGTILGLSPAEFKQRLDEAGLRPQINGYGCEFHDCVISALPLDVGQYASPKR